MSTESVTNLARANARSHFVEAVLPAYENFALHYVNRELGFRIDTRNAALICGALKDFPEHAVHELTAAGYVGQSASQLRKQLWQTNKAYKIVFDFADAWKHRSLDRQDRLFNSLDDVTECVATTRYDDHKGAYYCSRKLIEIKLIDGIYVDLGRAIKIAVVHASNVLLQLRMIPSIPNLRELLPAHPSRNDSRFEGDMLLPGEVGEAFSAKFRCFVYVDGNDLVEPSRTHRFGSYDIPCKSVIRGSQFDEKSS